jgi:hypothetical protein
MAAVRRPAALAGNHERARCRDQLDGVGIDARELDEDGEPVWILGL